MSAFDASLPPPHNHFWRQAYRTDEGETPRMATYQCPDGEPIPFILHGFRFSGGQSKDTAEYPFGGLWSNESLNEKPQSLNIEGFLRGADYIVRRNAMIEALRVPTCDDRPGYIDLPFWGRFPVVVGDRYEVSESPDQQGQCKISIPFTRAGLSIESRMQGLDGLESADVDAAAGMLEAPAIEEFETTLNSRIVDTATLRASFGQIKNSLLAVNGRIQGPKRVLNTMTSSVLGILSLVNQGINAPGQLAQAAFNSAAAIFAGLVEIRNSTQRNGRTVDNARNVLFMFLAASSFRLPGEAVTVSQKTTRTATENLYRTMAFSVSAKIIADMDFLTRETACGCWRLLEKLEDSIDKENPAVHSALRDTLSALSRRLSSQKTSTQKRRHFPSAVPVLYIAHYLGCTEENLRRMNRIGDSFLVQGDVLYV